MSFLSLSSLSFRRERLFSRFPVLSFKLDSKLPISVSRALPSMSIFSIRSSWSRIKRSKIFSSFSEKVDIPFINCIVSSFSSLFISLTRTILEVLITVVGVLSSLTISSVVISLAG
uniref:Uncharacterized protein n=1 Tax=Lepeophtheirus salmonis TaxID=72036 RepID=A0A0K2U0V4_LEPSM